MKRKIMSKFYLLYNDKQQSKLLTMAENEEIMKEENDYYTSGVWFSYDCKEGSNLLENEKEIKNSIFPTTPKIRIVYTESKNNNFKWVS